MSGAIASVDSSPRAPQESVLLQEHWLRVTFSQTAGDHADFHYQWLRHNCDRDRHPTTGERILCSSELPEHPRPSLAYIDSASNALQVVWAEESRRGPSVYPLSWLRENAYAYGRETQTPPSNDPRPLTIDAAGHEPSQTVTAALDVVRTHGLAIVRGYGLDTEALVKAFAQEHLRVRATHFGVIEDLRTDNTTNQNTDQLGYTDYPVHLHTDQPYLQEPPQYQLLQCMRPAETGGENYFVDGVQAARYLRDQDRHSYELLTRVPIRFHRQQKSFERTQESPLVTFDSVFGPILRYSYFTMAPHQVRFDQMEEWYRAYHRFAAVVNNPQHQYHATLRSGDFVLYNNHRMLHARKGFRGARWMRGIYFDELFKDV